MSEPQPVAGDAMGLFGLVQPEMQAVDRLITSVVTQEDLLVQRVADHLLQAGGKRVRPALVLMAGRVEDRPSEHLVPIAAAVELIHMATLVHDDIIDRADVRRGRPALRQAFDDQVAVLSGDFLFARAFQILGATGRPSVVATAADVVHAMCVGEIRQNLDHGRIATVAEYLRRIEAKTATFLAASCRLGALATNATAAHSDALFRFGWHVGMAFQLIDDLLDIVADPAKLGKSVASDFAQGVITLPVIYALERTDHREELLASLNRCQDPSDRRHVIEILDQTGSLSAVRAQAEGMVEIAIDALDDLPAGPARTALETLARFVATREF